MSTEIVDAGIGETAGALRQARFPERRWTHEGRPQLHRANFTVDPHTPVPAADGPWWGEPDKIQWVDEATGLDCLMVRNRFGVWCGYVGVGPDHPLHGQGYDVIKDTVGVDVHGGLTFSNSCDESAAEGHGICHVPYPGREHDVWWLGFDCGHFTDYSPGLAIGTGDLFDGPEITYKTEAFVKGECASLAAQLAGRCAHRVVAERAVPERQA